MNACRPRLLAGAVAAACALVGTGRDARAADPTLDECISVNERAGPLRQAGRLREARTSYVYCSAASCPAAVRDDCVAQALQLESAIPTVVFVAKDAAGNEMSAVTVTMDGQPMLERLDGKALEVDPGEHVFILQANGLTAVRHLVVHEGEKDRREEVSFGGPAPRQPPAQPVPGRAQPAVPQQPAAPVATTSTGSSGQKTLGIALTGVGAAGLVVAGVAGLLANGSWQTAQTDCNTDCSASSKAHGEASTAHTEATVANVSFAVGVVGVLVGAILWVTAPSPSRVTGFAITPFVGLGSGGIAATGTLP